MATDAPVIAYTVITKGRNIEAIRTPTIKPHLMVH
jgi:hypothetical protein